MHIADPTIGIFGANGIVGAGLPIAAGAATAAQLRRDGSVAVAFFGDGAVAHGTLPRSDQPRRGLAAAGDLLLREQRLRRVLAGVDPARGAARAARRRLRRRLRRGRRQRRRGDRDRDARGGRGDARRARSRRRRGRHLPLARPLRRRPGALPIARRGPGVGSARPAARQRAPAAIGGRHRRRARHPCSRRSRTSSTTPSRRRGG